MGTGKLFIVSCLFAIMFVLCVAQFGAAKGLWFEGNAAYSYRHKDFYVNHLTGYHLASAESRIGYSLAVKKRSILLEPYCVLSTINDLGSNEWNRVDWHNNLVYGVGVRFRVFPRPFLSSQTREFWVDVFSEYLSISYAKNDSFYAGHRPSHDVKAGARYRLVLGGVGKRSLLFNDLLWAESGGGAHYSRSSFFTRGQTDYFLLSIHVKLGLRFGVAKTTTIEPYSLAEVSEDIGNETWNKVGWNNFRLLGTGVRLKLSSSSASTERTVDAVVLPFVELVWMEYSKRTDYVPSYRPQKDVRAGVAIWLSFQT